MQVSYRFLFYFFFFCTPLKLQSGGEWGYPRELMNSETKCNQMNQTFLMILKVLSLRLLRWISWEVPVYWKREIDVMKIFNRKNKIYDRLYINYALIRVFISYSYLFIVHDEYRIKYLFEKTVHKLLYYFFLFLAKQKCLKFLRVVRPK